MADTAAWPRANVTAAFNRWSQSYDSGQNPLLTLEERYLAPLLPGLPGRDVLDLGCGTGRWLERLAARQPRRLTGIDLSQDMLAVAGAKLGERCRLVCADCETVRLPPDSADLVVASFLASYIGDLASFARALRAAVREEASVFLSDVHPATQSALQWRRGFHHDQGFEEVPTFCRSLDAIVGAFAAAGFRLRALIEPCFGDPERPIFERARKQDAFKQSCGLPAVYIAQFGSDPRSGSTGVRAQVISSVKGSRIGIGPGEAFLGRLEISDGRIASLGAVEGVLAAESRSEADLAGYLVLPGLINAHEHLEFALFPSLGDRTYRNAAEWARDIHAKHRQAIAAQRKISKKTRLWWGGIRNVLCGVTSVCHHNPFESAVFDGGFILRVLRDCGWAHSLAFDSGIARKYLDTAADRPFILHLAEGTDEESAAEIHRLAELGALGDRTVLVHGLGLDDEGFALVRTSGGSLIWCPSSNVFLFGRTLSRKQLESLASVCLGSDSPLTACGDLLDEIRFAGQLEGLTAEDLFRMVTIGAADVLRLREGQGSLRIGAPADFVALRDGQRPPAETLARSSWRDVELVVVGGEVELASAAMLERLPATATAGLEPLLVEGGLRWLRAPVAQLLDEATRNLGPEIRMNGRRLAPCDMPK
jgi:cytosine/adenosine deaminase-related metal-dependent hydrolase/SAM-dependent methyltransferase